MAPTRRTGSPARSRAPATSTPDASAEDGVVLTTRRPLPYYIVSAMCFFMACLHEAATPVVMGSLAKAPQQFPKLDHFGDATWKPGEVAFVLAVQYQVGGLVVFILSWMFFMAARNPAYIMLAYAGIALSSSTALGGLLIALVYDNPHIWSTPMLPVWSIVTGIGLVGALLDNRIGIGIGTTDKTK